MNHTYGPMGEHVTAFVEALTHLTVNETKNLAATWEAFPNSAQATAWDAAWDAAWPAARGVAWNVAQGVAGDVVWPAIQGAPRVAVTDAAVALVVLDLATRDCGLREACEILLAPARIIPALATVIDEAWEHAETITKEN